MNPTPKKKLLVLSGTHLLKLLPEQQRIADVVEGFPRATRSYNSDGAIAEHPSHDALLHFHAFYSIQVHLDSMPAEPAGFNDHALVGNRKLIRITVSKRCDEKREQRAQAAEDYPVIGGFKFHPLVFHQVAVDVLAHIWF